VLEFRFIFLCIQTSKSKYLFSILSCFTNPVQHKWCIDQVQSVLCVNSLYVWLSLLAETCHKSNNLHVNDRCAVSFFFWWRAPQQILRTHRSLEAYCATVWWRWLVFFFIFPCNGAPVEWKWQEKTEELGGRNCPTVTLSTTNPIWTYPGSNPDLRLSHGTALCS
jgi:hypothetical protein